MSRAAGTAWTSVHLPERPRISLDEAARLLGREPRLRYRRIDDPDVGAQAVFRAYARRLCKLGLIDPGRIEARVVRRSSAEAYAIQNWRQVQISEHALQRDGVAVRLLLAHELLHFGSRSGGNVNEATAELLAMLLVTRWEDLDVPARSVYPMALGLPHLHALLLAQGERRGLLRFLVGLHREEPGLLAHSVRRLEQLFSLRARQALLREAHELGGTAGTRRHRRNDHVVCAHSVMEALLLIHGNAARASSWRSGLVG